ncbi:MAG: MobA/MobL family protein [Eisenbergiella sp.]
MELPHNSLLRDFIENNFVDMGMWLTCDPRHRRHNPHAHILLTVRWNLGIKHRKNTSRKRLYCLNLKMGWEKQYPYKSEKKVYMTPSTAQEHGYIRADKHPKSTRFGRQNPVSEQQHLLRMAESMGRCSQPLWNIRSPG